MDSEKRTLLILGCGYLGGRLAVSALDKGWRVKAVSRSAASLEPVAARGAEVFAGQVEEGGWHAFAGDSVDVVVNCVSSAGGGLAGYERSYVMGNQSLGDWAVKGSFRGRALYTSSVSVYPDAEGDWVDEAAAELPSSARGRLMLQSEEAFRNGLAEASPVVLRLAGLYGPGRHLLLDGARSGAEELPGFGDYFLNLVRIEDVAGAIWSCIDVASVPPGIYNVGDNEPTLKSDIVAWLAERCGAAPPRFSGKVGADGAGARRLGDGGRPANRRVSNRRLRSVSDWRPRFATYREGFADLLLPVE